MSKHTYYLQSVKGGFKTRSALFSGTYDFLAMNHYTSRLASPGIDPKAKARFQDANFFQHVDKAWPSCQAIWLKVNEAILTHNNAVC